MRNILIYAVLLLIFGIFINCRSEEQSAPESNVKLSGLSTDDQVREAIFRSAGLSRIGKTSINSSYYLAVDGDQDPSDQLMDYLNNGGSFLKKASRSYISSREVGNLRDKFTDKQGARFSISKLIWNGPDKVTATAGYYKGNLDAESCTYTLVRENGVWKIISKDGCVVA